MSLQWFKGNEIIYFKNGDNRKVIKLPYSGCAVVLNDCDIHIINNEWDNDLRHRKYSELDIMHIAQSEEVIWTRH